MSVDLVWTPQAREDLIEIYTYIGLDNPSAAGFTHAKVRRRCRTRHAHPQALGCSGAGLNTTLAATLAATIVKAIVKPGKDSAANETIYDAVERPDDDLHNAVSCMVSGVDRRHCMKEWLTVARTEKVGYTHHQHNQPPQDSRCNGQSADTEFHGSP